MNRREADWRIMLLSLVGVLLIRLLAWGPGIEPTAHAGQLNQTIPTLTPSGQPAPPTEPARTPRPTEPPPEPSATSSPAPSPTGQPGASPTATAATAPTTVEVTASATSPAATVATVTTATAVLSTPSETPQPAASPTATQTSAPAVPTPTHTATAPGVPSGEAGAETLTATPEPLPPASSAGSGLWNSPYVWLAGGLVLIGAGIVVLLGRRRAG